MKTVRAVLVGAVMLWAFCSPPAVQANCVVTDTETFPVGTYLADDKCDTGGNKKVTTQGAGGATGGTANAAAPTLIEGSVYGFFLDLLGNLKVTLMTLIAGEDQTNNLLMTSGGAVRTFTLMTGVTTNTTSATQIIHSGGKTILATVSGTGSVSVTVDIYGDSDNTTGNGIWLCTASPSGTTRGTAQCNHQITKDYPYYHAVTTSISGTGATVQVDAIVGAIGSQQSEFKWSGIKVADALIKTGPGFLRCITIAEHDAAPTAGTISINDATSAGTGTVIFEWVLTTAVFTPIQVCPETGFTTGLYFDFTTTGDVNVGASYR